MTTPSPSLSVPMVLRPSGLSLAFAVLLFATVGYFLFWGFGYTQGHFPLVFTLATLFGVFMAFNIGGNDVANSFGTSVGAGTLSIKQALLVAAVFEVSGAVIAGGEVTDTIRKGIVDLSGMTVAPMDFVFIMMSALVAAALWLLFASKKGYPVSTTHSIIGAIVGSSIVLGTMTPGVDSLGLVQWGKIWQIAISWVLSPVLGGLMSYALFSMIRKHILNYNDEAEQRLKAIKREKYENDRRHKEAFERLSEIQKISYTHAMTRDVQVYHDQDYQDDERAEFESDYFKELKRIERQREDIDAHRALQNWVPLVAAGGAMIISAMLLFKGFKHLDLGLTTLNNYLIMGMIGAVVWMATFIFAKTLKGTSLSRSTFLMFSWMQVFTAAGFAFSHGSNDIANAIGPFAAILDVLRTGAIGAEATIPPIAMITFGVALIVGLWFIGKEVIQTVGHNLTAMHPASGFAAELAAAGVVMLASIMGLPVSSTHILIGAVLGIGLVNHQTNWQLMKPIGLAWVITLPAAGLISAIAFVTLRTLFG
ncbi:inorganic phosphate transporter [Halomonas sp. DP8Y7-1]|uniref:inorganic phosphate transporter n=1 Tax=unclassified Halomonas TaxID=2609666 RepID=UPI001C94A938|nr:MULTISPECIES: inorganic phosphate transporter [unclassified Halomonas]MBY5982897.1 inorganic phosphate transporter [Halomonas sp. DP5Y7-2]MBY6029099.1 inorganic phosphate transporter [Halomonas sp. DP8Y7-1]